MKKEGLFKFNFENSERIGYLIASFIKGTLTTLERKELDAWILESEQNEVLLMTSPMKKILKKQCIGMLPLTRKKPWNGSKREFHLFLKGGEPYPYC